MRLKQERKG